MRKNQRVPVIRMVFAALFVSVLQAERGLTDVVAGVPDRQRAGRDAASDRRAALDRGELDRGPRVVRRRPLPAFL